MATKQLKRENEALRSKLTSLRKSCQLRREKESRWPTMSNGQVSGGNIVSDISDHFSQICLLPLGDVKVTKMSNHPNYHDFSRFSQDMFLLDLNQMAKLQNTRPIYLHKNNFYCILTRSSKNGAGYSAIAPIKLFGILLIMLMMLISYSLHSSQR